MGWFEETFNEDYLTIYSHRNEAEAQKQIDFVLSQISPDETHRILDLACGNGRHSIALHQSGYQVTGLDLSLHLLAEAKQATRAAALRIPFVCADMRIPFVCADMRIPFVCADMRAIPFVDAAFDLVLSMFTSFGYFDSDRENFLVFEEVARLLPTGGYFFLDYLNPDVVRARLKPETVRHVGRMKVIEKRRINDRLHRVEKDIYLEKSGEIAHYRESVRLYEQRDIAAMLASVGFTLENTYGDYAPLDISATAPRMIFIARKTS